MASKARSNLQLDEFEDHMLGVPVVSEARSTYAARRAAFSRIMRRVIAAALRLAHRPHTRHIVIKPDAPRDPRNLGVTRRVRDVPPDVFAFDEEIRAHLELSAREQMLNGVDADTARRAALEEFGDVQAIRESMERVWSGSSYGAVKRVYDRVCGGRRI